MNPKKIEISEETLDELKRVCCDAPKPGEVMRIAIVDNRGLTFVGYMDIHKNDYWVTIRDARCVIYWGTTKHLAELAGMLEEGRIISTTGNLILDRMVDSERSPHEIASHENLLIQIDREALDRWMAQVLSENSDALKAAREDPKSRRKVLSYLVGQVMKLSRGTVPPQEVHRILEERLKL